MKLLVTGGCGFLGSNLARYALGQGIDLVLFDNLQRTGSSQNLRWLQECGSFRFVHGDIRSSGDVDRVISSVRPDVIFHLAGQVAMTTSIEQPRTDFEVNAYGTLNVLEAARLWVPKAPILYSSTNKVYGDLGQFSYMEGISRYRCVDKPDGIDEGTKLDFHSPYGCSKGAADQYMLDYARIYDLNTVVFRHSSMYGGRQFASYDQGWVGWFCMKAIEAKKSGGTSPPFTISGNGKQVRDVLHADDMVRLYFGSLARIASIRGQAFNIGGGKDNSLSLLELFSLLEKIIGVTLNYVHLPVRESDQRVFIADIRKAQTNIGWTPEVSAKEGVAETLRWIGSLGDHWTGR